MNPALNPQVLNRVRSEYLEMPGLTLKAAQLQRLCGIDQAACEAVIDTLIETGFLAMHVDGSYVRSKDADSTRARPARATLGSPVIASAARTRRRAS